MDKTRGDFFQCVLNTFAVTDFLLHAENCQRYKGGDTLSAISLTLRIIVDKPREKPIVDIYRESGVCSLEDKIKYLAKNWFNKALENTTHLIHENIPHFTYNHQDRHEAV